MSNKLLTAEQLATELGLPSGESVRNLTRKRRLPVVKVSYRCHRYDLDDCRKALGKYTVKAV